MVGEQGNLKFDEEWNEIVETVSALSEIYNPGELPDPPEYDLTDDDADLLERVAAWVVVTSSQSLLCGMFPLLLLKPLHTADLARLRALRQRVFDASR